MFFLENLHCQVTDAALKAVAACKQHCQVTDGGLPFAEGAEGCGDNLPYARESIRVPSVDCFVRTGLNRLRNPPHPPQLPIRGGGWTHWPPANASPCCDRPACRSRRAPRPPARESL